MSDSLNRMTGRVTIATASAPMALDCGRPLGPVQIVYETYGRLSARRDNAVVVCHALTGSAHAAGVSPTGTVGWWDPLIGPGRVIDTERFFVISTNVLGGCYGSTGPTSLDRETGRPYGDRFPTITIRDMVRAQRLLVESLGVERVHAVIGGSMGGMQALEWAALYPELVDRIVPMVTSARQSPWCIGFNAIAREALDLGRAAGDEAAGLRLARKVGMLSYRSSEELSVRFDRGRSHDDVEPVDGTFDVEGYLERHGRKLVERFDAATYRTLTRAMDLFDLGWGRGVLEDVLAALPQPALCIGVRTDVRYPVEEQRELAGRLQRGVYYEIDSVCGHDAFLIEHEQLTACLAPFLEAGDGAAFFTHLTAAEIPA